MSNDDIIKSLYEEGIIVGNNEIDLDSLTDELDDEFADIFREEKTDYNRDIDERFQYLIDGEMKINEGELEPRKVISSKLSNFLVDEEEQENSGTDFFEDIKLDVEALKKMHEEEQEKEHVNLDNRVSNIPEEELNEYILIRGTYSSVFKEFIQNDSLLPKGDFPIAIEVNDTVIKYKSITPDPKTLYRLKKTLAGYNFIYVNEGEEQPLDIFQFLGKLKFTV